MARRNIKVSLHHDWCIDENWRLDEFVKMVEGHTKNVPPQYADSVMVAFESEYDSSSIQLEIYYMRPQTKDEADAEEAERVGYAQRAEREERANYERLKAKYGS